MFTLLGRIDCRKTFDLPSNKYIVCTTIDPPLLLGIDCFVPHAGSILFYINIISEHIYLP